MKITKAKLIEIIEEEIEEIVSVTAHPRMAEFPRGDFTRFSGPAPKKRKPERKTQVELPSKDAYSQMLGIIKAKLGNTIDDDQAEDLAKSLSDTLTGEK